MSEQSSFILPGTTDFLNPEQVNKIHSYADTDTGTRALHHTLGRGQFQAAVGTHVHWGSWKSLTSLGWSPYSGLANHVSNSYTPGMARKSLDGRDVEMVGVLTGSTAWAAGQWIFTMPAGYRPPSGKTEILVGGTDTGGAQQYGRFDIVGANGAVIAQFALAAGANIFLGRMRWSTTY